MKISQRLHKIAEMVKYPTVVDVGTDHALLPIYLVQNGLAERVLATDVAEGPLARARENIAAHGLADAVETRLCNGLDGVGAGFQTCIIAGMGGNLIIEILRHEAAHSFAQLLLSPQRNAPDLRRFLHISGYTIAREAMVEENGKFYNILDCAVGDDDDYSEIDYLFGKQSSPVFARFIEAETAKTKAIISGLNDGNPRKIELEKYLQCCEEVRS